MYILFVCTEIWFSFERAGGGGAAVAHLQAILIDILHLF